MRTHIELPKFTITCEFELAAILAAMGMPHAFADANFSGITGSPELAISDVIHKAFVVVDEQGTEAAAATAVKMKRIAMPPTVQFRVDHPFVFLIKENATGTILFLGRIADPTR